jgi:hypothetical protein
MDMAAEAVEQQIVQTVVSVEMVLLLLDILLLVQVIRQKQLVVL